MLYVFLGIQGSGKGTQAQLLCREFGYEHINIGELFRTHIKNQTEIGQKAAKYLAVGHLVPDEIVYKVLEAALSTLQEGYCLDGFPRTLPQAEYISKRYHIEKVIYLDLSDEIAMERMLSRRICSKCKRDYNTRNNLPAKPNICDTCGGKLICREDDTPELMANRLALFHSETKPLLAYFQMLRKVVIVNAATTIEDNYAEIRKILLG
jgi:adenylate kinase